MRKTKKIAPTTPLPLQDSPKPEAKQPAAPKKTPSVTTRPPVERMLHIHHALRSRSWPNCVQLGKELRFSPRTIARDIEFMRSRMDLPIEYDEVRKGFYYTRDDVEFPGMKITTGELIALTVARLSIERYRGTSFEPFLRSAFAKLTENMGDEISFNWNELEAVISFRGADQESDMDLEVFQPVFDALLGREEIRFTYHKLHSPAPEERHARPLHLACIGRIWYILVHDLLRGDIRSFALCRMNNVRSTGIKFERPASFRPEEKLAHSIGIYGGTPERVRLRLTDIGAKLLREQRLHSTQRIGAGADGTSELTMNVAITPELEHSLLRWGMHVEVMEPQRLREALLEHARAIAARG